MLVNIKLDDCNLDDVEKRATEILKHIDAIRELTHYFPIMVPDVTFTQGEEEADSAK